MSAPTSRWLTMQLLCGCRYSIGSSMVMMCSCRSVLILSMIDASVVRLAGAGGPGDEDESAGLLRQISLTIGGRPSSWKVRILKGMVRNAPATAPRCMKMLARKRDSPFTPNERSSSFSSSNLCFCASVEDGVAELLGLDRSQRRGLQRDQPAVDAQLRRRAGGDVEVATLPSRPSPSAAGAGLPWRPRDAQGR